ncbi:hypothetical protein [Caballeronia mineralivorans]|jgi:hypothetical protein|uniref:hypothetical protein n=1 Tax=Caballeronia mineralivorans TaxID=2010198 RepID=UPI0023F0409B|nr:hypothetical protein [Caballeronia mineralivorans]MDB5788221.1 hypothetical protein [Caballeronia mineralivorans]
MKLALRTTSVLGALIVVALAPALARAACHFNTPAVLACTNERSAVQAYQAFGTDYARSSLSYNRQLLFDAGCTGEYAHTYKTDKIERIGAVERVATPNGWVSVMVLAINDRDLLSVAGPYISGVCDIYKPRVSAPLPPPPGAQDGSLPKNDSLVSPIGPQL